MKSYRHLYPRVHDFENLYRAYRKARKGKRGRPEVATFEFRLEDNLVRLQEEHSGVPWTVVGRWSGRWPFAG